MVIALGCPFLFRKDLGIQEVLVLEPVSTVEEVEREQKTNFHHFTEDRDIQKLN